MTAVIAAQTQRITIGWGIISPYTRHPVQIAMEARVMQDACGDGRFLLGLGASKIFMKEIGEGEKGRDAGPAVVMRESIEIVEAMLAGKLWNTTARRSTHQPLRLRPMPTSRGRACPSMLARRGRCCNGLRDRIPMGC